MEILLKISNRLQSLLGFVPYEGNDRATSELNFRLKKARRAWTRQMKNLKNELGVVILPDLTPELTADHLKNCQVVANRETILHKMKKGGITAEVGVQEGNFSKLILEICHPRELHLIDTLLSNYSIESKFKSEIDRGQVLLHENDSATAINKLPDNHFDFIYIDADHSYKGVQRDIQAAKTKIKEGGFLIFNDYTYWSPGECINYGVIRAVNELCIMDNWEMIYFALAGYMYCDVAIRKFD
ncbi:MAG TPA: class I SAM-dependent methyltransferase [Puia sp.]|nr:class I SAM-dependent methyltransferase [Puia sp.]